MVALITPMHSNGDVDWQSLANLIDWQIEQGTDVLVSVGTTGESATLSMQEHVDVIEFTMKQVGGRIPSSRVQALTIQLKPLSWPSTPNKRGGCRAVGCALLQQTDPEGLYLHYKAILLKPWTFPKCYTTYLGAPSWICSKPLSSA